jgi:predicted DsbA family dithiol-disulfide isomerase
MDNKMHVEIWSDIACPWCYVGKRRFEAALQQFEHRDHVVVTWRSFELDPAAAAERAEDSATHLAHKYGRSLDEAHAMQANLAGVAAGEGLEFHFDRLRLTNTFDAHRLVHLAAEHGLQDGMKERLMRAYLTEGELLADHAVLTRVGVEAGLPASEIGMTLATDRFADAVRDDERTAASLGINAVPFFVAERAIGASGAQPPELLLQLLTQAWESRTPAIPTLADGAACGPDGC